MREVRERGEEKEVFSDWSRSRFGGGGGAEYCHCPAKPCLYWQRPMPPAGGCPSWASFSLPHWALFWATWAAIGIGLARLLLMLLGVVFTIPAQGLAWPLADLATLVGRALLGMFVSAWISSRCLAGVKVVEALREL